MGTYLVQSSLAARNITEFLERLFAPLVTARSAPLVVCKVQRLYTGISKDIIVAHRHSAPRGFAPLVMCKHPYN